jgi:hypothetical protein
MRSQSCCDVSGTNSGGGCDAMDAWLLERYRLLYLEGSQVRRTVCQGRQVTDPAHKPAAHALAAEVLYGSFQDVRLPRTQLWDILVSPIMAAATVLISAALSSHKHGVWPIVFAATVAPVVALVREPSTPV